MRRWKNLDSITDYQTILPIILRVLFDLRQKFDFHQAGRLTKAITQLTETPSILLNSFHPTHTCAFLWNIWVDISEKYHRSTFIINAFHAHGYRNRHKSVCRDVQTHKTARADKLKHIFWMEVSRPWTCFSTNDHVFRQTSDESAILLCWWPLAFMTLWTGQWKCTRKMAQRLAIVYVSLLSHSIN